MGRDITNNGVIEGDCITGDQVVNILFKAGSEADQGINGIATRLHKAMRNKRLSAFQLEKKSGISKFLICEYLDGIAEPSLKNIVKLAECLDVTLDWLIRGKQDKFHLEKRIELLEKFVLDNGNYREPCCPIRSTALATNCNK